MKKIENNFTVSGFVGKDAEIRQFANASVARFSLAVGRQEKNGEETNRVWKSHSTLTLLATQDLPTFLYYMIDPLKSWCWGAILFYPFKNSRFS